MQRTADGVGARPKIRGERELDAKRFSLHKLIDLYSMTKRIGAENRITESIFDFVTNSQTVFGRIYLDYKFQRYGLADLYGVDGGSILVK